VRITQRVLQLASGVMAKILCAPENTHTHKLSDGRQANFANSFSIRISHTHAAAWRGFFYAFQSRFQMYKFAHWCPTDKNDFTLLSNLPHFNCTELVYQLLTRSDSSITDTRAWILRVKVNKPARPWRHVRQMNCTVELLCKLFIFGMS
jgi:hypothetical protein